MARIYTVLIILIVGFGLTGSAAPERGFDVNDVTFLFPLIESKAKAYPEISLNGPVGGKILGPNLFKNIDDQVQKLTSMTSRFPYKHWRIAALRYDPCFPKSAQESQICLEQIRLIAQPMIGRGFEDVSMHLLFQIHENPVRMEPEIIQTLRSIKNLSDAETRGAPLGVHPGLAKELGANSSKPAVIAKALIHLIQSFCQEKNLKEVTFTDSDFNNDGPWFFIGGSVANGKWTPVPIAGLADPSAMMQTSDSGGFVLDHLPKPNVGIHAYMDLTDEGMGPSKHLSEEKIYQLHRTENPLMANPRNTDCASCHLVSPTSFGLQFDGKESKDLFRSPLGITGYALAANAPIVHAGLRGAEVVRVLGYALSEPIVTPIVANSSALVANQINQALKLGPPTDRDCRGHEHELKFCLLGNNKISSPTVNVDTQTCFKRFCR